MQKLFNTPVAAVALVGEEQLFLCRLMAGTGLRRC